VSMHACWLARRARKLWQPVLASWSSLPAICLPTYIQHITAD